MNARALIKNLYLGLRKIILALCIRVPRENKSIPSSILVIRIDRIGDLVVSLPAIKALKTIFPGARLAVLTQRSALSLLNGIDYIDEGIPYEGFWKTTRVLRRKNFSLAVDLLMDYTLRTALIAHLSKASVTAGFDIAARGRCFTVAVKPSGEKKMMYQHTLDLALAIARFFNIDTAKIPKDKPSLTVTRDSEKAAQHFLQKHGVPAGARILGIHPGAKFPSQCWDHEKFAKLAENIKEKYHASIVIIGSSQEQALVNKVASMMKTPPVLAVGLSLGELAAVMSRMDIIVCNNSGPLHIAAALGVPTVSTMGPTDPYLWHPAGERQTVIRKELPCSPCNNAVCRQHLCMEMITTDEVLKETADSLEKRGTLT